MDKLRERGEEGQGQREVGAQHRGKEIKSRRTDQPAISLNLKTKGGMVEGFFIDG